MEDWTTIAIKDQTKKKLDSIKVHPKQANDEVVDKLIDFWVRYKGVVV